MRTLILVLALLLYFIKPVYASQLQAGVGIVDITPYDFERRPVDPKNPHYKNGDPFYDTGVDGLFDYEEPGAFGKDGKPGVAEVDDDKDGFIDNCDRKKCDEYMAKGSDDVYDPNHDNYDPVTNPTGTEGDGVFQFVHLGGFSPYNPFGQNRLASGINDPLWARALSLRGSNGTPLVMVATDLPGLAWKHINPVRRRIERNFGIPRANIIIASTHVHSAPDAAGFWSSLRWNHNHDYTEKLREWIYQAAAQALMNMKPAAMKVVTTTHYSCIDAQTGELKKDPDCHLPHLNYEYNEPGNRFDKFLIQRDQRDPIVRNTKIVAAQFISLSSGETIGTFVNWNNHPDSWESDNMLISSDYSHYLRQYVEQMLGGRTIYFIGTLGCQIGALRKTPVPLWNENYERISQDGKPVLVTKGKDKIRSIGYEVGSEVVKALQAENHVSSDIPVSIRTEPVDIQITNLIHLIGTSSVWHYDVEPPDELVHDSPRCGGKYGCVRQDVSILQIGDLGMATAPGEIDPSYLWGRPEGIHADYGKYGKWTFPAMPALVNHIPGRHRAMLGQANNYLSYLLHAGDNVGQLNYKHPVWYEDFVTVGKNFGDDVGNKLMQMLGSSERFSKREIYPKLNASGNVLEASQEPSEAFSSPEESNTLRFIKAFSEDLRHR